jgi:hypothetical protein
MRRLLLAVTFAFAAAPAAAEPPTTHEIIYNRPSGFWTSNAPAVGGAYKWRLMEVGIAVGLLTGLLLARAIKRANAERAARTVLPEARTESR